MSLKTVLLTLDSQLASNRNAYSITLDTSGKGLYGYSFVVNPEGSPVDGNVTLEGTQSEQWSEPWLGKSEMLTNGWSVEFFLPWSMMELLDAASERVMGFRVERKVAQLDESDS